MQSSELNFLPIASKPIPTQASVSDVPSNASDASSTNAVAYDAALLLIPIGFVALWAAIVYVISDTWKLSRKNIAASKPGAQLPCKKCQFFNNNPYIKCAVNPEIALTKDAAECSDFRPRDRKQSVSRGCK